MVLKRFLLNLIVGLVCLIFFILFRTLTHISTPIWIVLLATFFIISIFNSLHNNK